MALTTPTMNLYKPGTKRQAEGEASGAPAAKTAAVQGSNGLNNGPVSAAPAVTPTVPRQLIAVSQGQVINKLQYINYFTMSSLIIINESD